MATISIVMPVYNEAACLPVLYERLCAVRQASQDKYEFIFVDDGSGDRSAEIVQKFAARDEDVQYVLFSRNFGHEAATTAGIDHASGDAVVLMDSDLQDPPEVIPELIAKWREGYQVVYAQRRKRKGETIGKRASSWLFYRIIRWLSDIEIPPDTGDFRLMDRCVAEQFRRCRESNRFVRGLVAWAGFRQTAVLYDRHERAGGRTKYNIPKLLVLALDAAIGFSNVPLRVSSIVGLFVCLFAMVMAAIVFVKKVVWNIEIPGYALIVVGMFFLGGVQLFMIGLLGEYLGRLYRESQGRPLYIVARKSPSLPGGFEGWHGPSERRGESKVLPGSEQPAE